MSTYDLGVYAWLTVLAMLPWLSDKYQSMYASVAIGLIGAAAFFPKVLP